MEDALKSIATTKKDGVLVLLSDGGITNVQAVLQLAASYTQIRIFTIGIGNSVSQELMQGLANVGKGKCEFIGSADSDAIRTKVMSQLLRSQNKRSDHNLLDISFASNTENTNENPHNYIMIPEQIDTIYDGDNNVAFIFSENPISKIQYNRNLTEITIESVKYEGNPLHRVAGTKLINNYMQRKSSLIQSIQQDAAKITITKISKNIGILSAYTSFIAVEYRMGADRTLDMSTFKEIPLQYEMKSSCNDSFGRSGFTHIGINTIGQSLKNANVNIMAAPALPWISSGINSRRGVHDKGMVSQQGFVESTISNARSTTKQTQDITNYMGQVSQKNSGSQKYLYDNSRPTTKQSQHITNYMGQVSQQQNLGSQKYFYDQARPTMKTTTHVSGYMGSVSGYDEPDLNTCMTNYAYNFSEVEKREKQRHCTRKYDYAASFDTAKFNNVFDGHTRNLSSGQPEQVQSLDHTSETAISLPHVKISLPNLENCSFVGKSLLMSNKNEKLSMSHSVNVGDYIALTNSSPNKGTYKVISIGSDSAPWVLERVSNSIPVSTL